MSRELLRRCSYLAGRVITVLLLAGAACAFTRDGLAQGRQGDPYETLRRYAFPREGTVDYDTVRAGRFDSGRMWTFDFPPRDYLKEAYDFSPDDRWFERARLGALRIPGCTASFVSPHGLMMTNHHCGRSYVSQVSKPGEALLDKGFYAASLAEERPAEGLYAEQLVAIRDVTDEVYAALDSAQTDAERMQARQDVIAGIEARVAEEAGGEATGFHAQVISLYHGGKYSAYTFKRYDDVRLVMAPEVDLGYFGGDADNFTYPRYTLDVTLFRVYDGGRPLTTTDYFPWSEDGSKEGDLVFVVGNPGSTSRLEAVAQLEYRRDVHEKALLSFFKTRIAALQAYAEAHPEESEALGVRNRIFSLLNAEKLYEGRVKALEDSLILARRRDSERQFREALAKDPALNAEFGDEFDRMAEIQRSLAELAPAHGAFLIMQHPYYTSPTLRRALVAYPILAQATGGTEGGGTDALREKLLAIPGQPAEMDAQLLQARLRDFVTYFGADSELVRTILNGRTPEAAASDIVEGSVLADSLRMLQALEEGTLTVEDPALQLAAALAPTYNDYQSASAGLTAQQEQVASNLGRARFAVYGTAMPPDATFSLRLADGVVKGYPYNGTVALPYTTFYGLYDAYYSHGKGTEWDLPERWVHYPETFDLSTPLNLVTTADIIGGNSGSPLLNRDLEIVGLVFDGNIESLSADYINLDDGRRSVAVDSRGMLEALDEIYDADRLVLELTAGRLVPTEAEADAAMSVTQ